MVPAVAAFGQYQPAVQGLAVVLTLPVLRHEPAAAHILQKVAPPTLVKKPAGHKTTALEPSGQ